MTYGARLLAIILVFHFLIANPVSLENSIIPKIDCNDLNRNGHPDFIAVNSSLSPRLIYHIEFKDSVIEFLWEYSMPEDAWGYFADMILGDFDNDGVSEMIAAAYKNGGEKIFYIFPVDDAGFSNGLPQIMGIGNSSYPITHPWKLYPMNIDLEGYHPFIVTQGSPSRQIILCKYFDGKINRVGSYGDEFLDRSTGSLELSLGNFDKDGIEDIFIFINGPNPEGYFIFSDGSEEKTGLNIYPRLSLLYKRGVDLNFDGTDDLLMIDRNGLLMSNIWRAESIDLSESNIQNISVNLDNGLVDLTSINQMGKIGHYIIDPLTRNILTSEYNFPELTTTEYVRVHSLITKNHILLINDGQEPEIWSLKMTETPSPDHLQRIYSRTPDYVINRRDVFIHPIETDTIKSFLHFTGEYLPPGMKFNLDDIQLEWTPTISQLGFYEFSYTLELREIGDLEMEIENDVQLVSQKENILNEKHSYLIYVNDPVIFNNEEDHITFVNTKPSEWIIPIEDNNVDALLKVQKIAGDKTAVFQLLQSEIKEELLDSVIIESEEVIQTGNLDAQFQDISNSQINHHMSKFFWTPNTDNNDFQFSLTVSDGYSSDTLALTVTIHPEIDLNMNLTDLNATVNQTINVPVKLKQSPSSDDYVYGLINAPENMWVTESGVINWIPMTTDVDDNIFSIKVSDGIGTSELQYNVYVNATPVISSRPSDPFIVNMGDLLAFPLENFDMNKNAKLTWKLLSGPIDMIVNSEGVLTWEANQLDYHPYEIQLSDGIDSVAWNGSIYVNVPPIITSRPVIFISGTELYEYQLEAQDYNNMNHLNPDADAKIEFELVQGPEGMKIDDQNILKWEPAKNISGEFSVSIIASDGIDDTPQNFQLLVNSFPVITSMDSFSVKIGDTLNYYISAIDSNPEDTLLYIIDDMQPGMNLDESSGLLTWIPSQSDIGQHHFNLTVKDGGGKSGTKQDFQIFVYKLPVFTGDLLGEAFVGLEYKAFLTAEDMFGKKLRKPEAITIEKITIIDYHLSGEYGRYFQWTPSKLDIGKHEIHIRIKDDYGFSTLHTYSISVYKNPCLQCTDSQDSSPADTTRN